MRKIIGAIAAIVTIIVGISTLYNPSEKTNDDSPKPGIRNIPSDTSTTTTTTTTTTNLDKTNVYIQIDHADQVNIGTGDVPIERSTLNIGYTEYNRKLRLRQWREKWIQSKSDSDKRLRDALNRINQ